jgi:hypothetical protein
VSQGSQGISTAVQIQVSSVTKVAINDIFTDISQDINMTGNTITATLIDSQQHTTMINMTLFESNVTIGSNYNLGTLCYTTIAHVGCTLVNSNGTGFVVYHIGGSYFFGQATATFTLNPSYLNEYTLSYTFKSTVYGTDTIGPYAVIGGNFFAIHVVQINNCVLGLCALLTSAYQLSGTDIIFNILGVMMVIGFAGAFGPRFGSIGVLLTVFFGLALSYGGFIPLIETGGSGFLAFMAFLASVNFMKESEKRIVTEAT